MNYTDLELKLIAHALDAGLNRDGEADNASRMFFKQLRNRGVKAHDFTAASSNGSTDYKSLYNTERYNASLYRMEAATAKQEVAELKAKLGELTRKFNEGGSRKPHRSAAQRKLELLSDMEWKILQRIATYWGSSSHNFGMTDSVSTRYVAENNSERGSLSTMIRKGVIEKRYSQRVGLTEKGVAYYNERKQRS